MNEGPLNHINQQISSSSISNEVRMPKITSLKFI